MLGLCRKDAVPVVLSARYRFRDLVSRCGIPLRQRPRNASTARLENASAVAVRVSSIGDELWGLRAPRVLFRLRKRSKDERARLASHSTLSVTLFSVQAAESWFVGDGREREKERQGRTPGVCVLAAARNSSRSRHSDRRVEQGLAAQTMNPAHAN
eukprot:365244-Chlamydomonas_euryale.AAC.14